MSDPFEMSDDTPVYVISVAAQLSGLHPQTLRAYDRMGLVSPGRAAGRGRRYSLRDILALREVQRLSQEDGVNLSGIKRILELENELEQFQRALAEMTADVAQLRAELESTRAVAARLAGLVRGRAGGAELVPVKDARGPIQDSGPGPQATADFRRPALPAARAAAPTPADQDSPQPARTEPANRGPTPTEPSADHEPAPAEQTSADRQAPSIRERS